MSDMGIGNMVGGFSQAMATKEAGKAAASASQNAAMINFMVARKQREDLEPWRIAGGEAVNELAKLVAAGPGEFTASPSYEFRVSEGINAIEQSAAAKGKLLSGQTMKGIEQYGQEMASMEYDNWLNQWYKSLTPYQSLAGLGSQTTIASNQLSGASMNMGAANIAQAGMYNAAAMYGMGQTMGNTMASTIGAIPAAAGSIYGMATTPAGIGNAPSIFPYG